MKTLDQPVSDLYTAWLNACATSSGSPSDIGPMIQGKNSTKLSNVSVYMFDFVVLLYLWFYQIIIQK